MVEYWDSDKEAVMQVYYRRIEPQCMRETAHGKEEIEKQAPVKEFETRQEGGEADCASIEL
jgi:hypothetical protein